MGCLLLLGVLCLLLAVCLGFDDLLVVWGWLMYAGVCCLFGLICGPNFVWVFIMMLRLFIVVVVLNLPLFWYLNLIWFL